MPTREFDLLIVGGGAAGLSAAISSASEGLNVGLLDSAAQLGGQAGKSSAIENYPGFATPISGDELMARCIAQARRFNTNILCPQNVVGIVQDGKRQLVVTDDEQSYLAKAVVLSLGLDYRRLMAKGIGDFMGRGILYGAPTTDPSALGECIVSIVGGANSAGQAAMHLSKNPKAKVRLLVRKALDDQMSDYLIKYIRAAPNIEVLEGVEVVEAFGDSKLQEVALKKSSSEALERLQTHHLFIFIGAQPRTFWLNGHVAVDAKKFIVTGADLLKEGRDVKWQGVWKHPKRSPLRYETSLPGVFACGDVRLGSTKRVAAAFGEGSGVIQICHEFLALDE